MKISKVIFSIGILLLALAVLQWKLHAKDKWIGEEWDSEEQEDLYYYVLAPASTFCIFITPILMWIGL